MFGRGSLVGTFVAIAFAVAAAPASATVDVTNHNDPAGDPTVISYRIQIPSQAAPIDFALHDGEYKGFGPFEGLVVVQALVPAGWKSPTSSAPGPTLRRSPSTCPTAA